MYVYMSDILGWELMVLIVNGKRLHPVYYFTLIRTFRKSASTMSLTN